MNGSRSVDRDSRCLWHQRLLLSCENCSNAVFLATEMPSLLRSSVSLSIAQDAAFPASKAKELPFYIIPFVEKPWFLLTLHVKDSKIICFNDEDVKDVSDVVT